MKFIIAASAAVLFAGTAQAVAQPGDCAAIEQIAESDLNSDGTITRDEILIRRTDIFNRLDRNEDGYAEMSDAPRPARGRLAEALNPLLEEFDANGDGRLSSEEFLEGPTVLFDAADANEDDIVDQEERMALASSAC